MQKADKDSALHFVLIVLYLYFSSSVFFLLLLLGIFHIALHSQKGNLQIYFFNKGKFRGWGRGILTHLAKFEEICRKRIILTWLSQILTMICSQWIFLYTFFMSDSFIKFAFNKLWFLGMAYWLFLQGGVRVGIFF